MLLASTLVLAGVVDPQSDEAAGADAVGALGAASGAAVGLGHGTASGTGRGRASIPTPGG
jgi:hypothetical protein